MHGIATRQQEGRSSVVPFSKSSSRTVDVAVIGGGLGGVAAVLSALRLGRNVVLSEGTDWLGGQATSQGVAFDEHPWVEQTGASRMYRRLREAIRQYYRDWYPLLPDSREDPRLNPGMGFSSQLCFEPRIGHLAIMQLLARYLASGQLEILFEHQPTAVQVDSDAISSVVLTSSRTGSQVTVEAGYFVDATELGELLELGGVEHVIGAEAAADTGELHASEVADPMDQQCTTWCYAVDYLPGEDHTIDRPVDYSFWQDYKPPFWPGSMLSWTVSDAITGLPYTQPLFVGSTDDRILNDLWHYRRIFYRQRYPEGTYPSDVTLVKWASTDYWLKPMVGVSPEEQQASLHGAMQLSLSLLYWMQTEAPRSDGGTGYPGLRLRGDVFGTEHGLAKHVYVRESRRIKAEFTVLEQHIGVEARPGASGSESFFDSVGLGACRIDLHPTVTRNYLDIDAYPFEVPLGALIPVRIKNLIAGCKNIGSTHITNGSYRWHHVEWAIGEAAGALAAEAVNERVPPTAIRNSPHRLEAFQRTCTDVLGIQNRWLAIRPLNAELRPGSPSANYGGRWLEVSEDGASISVAKD